jgi:acetyl esterase/lipase
MPDDPTIGTLHVPARTVPVPSSISAEARAALLAPPGEAPPAPPLDDHDAWRARIATMEAAMLPRFEALVAGVDAEVEVADADGVTVYVVTPADGPHVGTGRVYLDIHGGSLILGGGPCCRAMGIRAAARVGARTWAVDYRLPPDHPYPAPLDDCVAAYRRLLADHAPGDIVIGGASAGGNLAAATVLRARDEGLPLPAGLVLLTPELDLTESGDSFATNIGVDTVLRRSQKTASRLYAGGHDLAHPYLSPLFGDLSAGFPPTLLQAGTRDLFLSNAVRMHRALRRAGMDAELHVWEAMPHGGFFGAPEDDEVDDEVRRFVARCWTRGRGTA